LRELNRWSRRHTEDGYFRPLPTYLEQIMKLNLTSEVDGDTLSARELDHVVGGTIVYQFGWVSPMAIHGFNPQPDPPAILAHALPGATGHA
jgi:hypothetical protein